MRIWRKLSSNYDKRILLFLGVLSINIIVFWLAAAVTDWESTRTSLFRWHHWFFMDWFGELHRIQTGIYTGEDIANYPAFCFLIFRIFYSLLPENEGVIYDDFNIRAMQSSVIPFAVFMVVLFFCFYHIFRYQMRSKSTFEREAMAILLLLSAPFLCVFERGNLIIIALVCTFLYVMLYDSEKKAVRMLSYVCLSIAAAIKLYPAVFGIFTLLKKRYKETIVLILLGCGIFFVPFAFFGGIDGCIAFFSSIMGSFETYYDYGFGFDFSIYNLERLIISLCSGYQTSATNISIIIVLFCLIVTFICVREFWQRVCVLSLAIVLLPKFSYFYTTCFLAIPLLYMLQSKERKSHYLYICEFLLVFSPWLHIPLETVNYLGGEEFSHTMGVGHVTMYIGILSLMITLLVDGILQRIHKKKAAGKVV